MAGKKFFAEALPDHTGKASKPAPGGLLDDEANSLLCRQHQSV